MQGKRPDRREKTRRAWGACLELLDAAEWMRDRLQMVLRTFGVTMEEFRLLALLYREGPLTLREAASRRGRDRRNIHRTIREAEESGWVLWEVMKHTGAEGQERGFPKDRRGGNNHGPMVGVMSLTKGGERLIEQMLPAQERAAGGLLRGIDGREQVTLGYLCRKLRGDGALGRMLLASALMRAHEEEESLAAG